MDFVWLLVGLAVLTVGAEILVRGASAFALAMKISPLVVGLTVVAFGTSAPELVVSLQSALRAQADLAVGNVVGSNIFNVLFILGVSALIVPLVVSQQLVRLEVPVLIALSAAVWGMAADGHLVRYEGIFLVGGLILYTGWTIRSSRKENAAVVEEYQQEFSTTAASPIGKRLLVQLGMIAAGLLLLVLGARLLSDAAVSIARQLGVSELAIGLTIVAAGTSLPEVATSILAAIRGERDIAVGNVVGSNLFNILGVLGLSSTLAGDVPVPAAALGFDLPVMTAVTLACLPIFWTGHAIARWEGALFLCYYVLYVSYLFLSSEQSTWLGPMRTLTWTIVIPLTLFTLLASGLTHVRKAKE